MSFTTKVEQVPNHSRPWLVGKFGLDGAISIALDQSLFASNSDQWPDDVLPSGLIVAAIIGPGAPEYGPWVPDATNGQQFAAGVLLNPVELDRTGSGMTGYPEPDGINRSSGAMLRFGTLVYEEMERINPDLSEAPLPLWASPAAAQAIIPSTAQDVRFGGLGGLAFIRRSQLSN